jgi:orotate phosphoribosyltransferase
MNGIGSEATIHQINEITALQLWKQDAIKVDVDRPFRLVSGNHSPIYINCRQLISNPLFMQLFSAFAQITCGHYQVTFDAVAGNETAGIPFASYLACNMNLPLVYVRKAAKAHGIASLVEGKLRTDATVILIDDVVTDAATKLKAIESVSASGGKVNDVLVVFDREQDGADQLRRNNIRLLALTGMSGALQTGKKFGLLSSEDLEAVNDYLHDPSSWHQRKGLPYQ